MGNAGAAQVVQTLNNAISTEGVKDFFFPGKPRTPKIKKPKVLTAEQQRAKSVEKTRILQIRSRSAQGFDDNAKLGGSRSLLGGGG